MAELQIRPESPKEQSAPIQTQPSAEAFQPWKILAAAAAENNEENFDELLEQYQSTAGFEIVADTNLFKVRHRLQEKDPYTKVTKYDILDAESQQYLFVSTKDYNHRCFHWLISTTISVFTDCYKDPIFITNSYFCGQPKRCCTIATFNGGIVGAVEKIVGRRSTTDYTIFNEYENSTLNIIETSLDDDRIAFDVWDGMNCVATIARTDEKEITVCTTGSLTSVNKILLLGFTFYVDGVCRGDSAGLNLNSLLGF